MKKFYSMLCAAALASASLYAQKGNLIFTSPYFGSEYQVTNVSPNGKWACGAVYDGSQRGFVWNLTTGEITELSTQGSNSLAMKVSNDGTVSGSFETTVGTPNNVPTETYGVWKDGKWTALELENKENGAKILRDGYAAAISHNNKYVAGIGGIGDDYFPILWKEGKLEVIDDISGSVYDVSEDGKILCGWTTHPVKKNRTCVIWKQGEDGKYEKTFTDLDSPWSAGPFCVASDISTNMRYVIAFNRVWDLTTNTYVEHDFSYAFSGFELTGVTNKGEAYGFHDTGDFPGGADRKAIKVTLDKQTIDIKDFLTSKGVDFGDFTYVQRVTGISDDENTYALTGYDANFFPHSVIVKLDVDTTIMAPVALKNRQLDGVNANHISWKAPLKNAKAVKGYNVYRNGNKINSELLTTNNFIDSELALGEYNYAVTAVYDSQESEKSEPITVNVKDTPVEQPRSLTVYQSSLNDVRLLWEAPYSNLPCVRYCNHDEVVGSLGGGTYSFEAAIATHESDLAVYKKNGYQIAQISFVPKSAQKSWTVNFYTADNDDEPIYSEVIPNEGLVYGIENYYTLKNPVVIPDGKDVIMSIAIDATDFGGYNVIGIAPKKAEAGYSDLIRQEGEKDFYSMYESGLNNEDGPIEYNICWAMSMHFAKSTEVADNAIKQYIISANSKEVGNTAANKYRIENLEDGEYTFEVVAEYANGKKSAPVATTMNLVANKGIYQPIVPTVETNLGTATVTWNAPTDEDAAVISFANTPKSGGLVGSERNQWNYAVATRYYGEKLQPYEDFQITGFRFFPLCDAEFTFFLKVNGEDLTEVALENGEGYVLNQWNTVKLEEPIKLNRHDEYTLILDCYDVTPKKAPIGIDSEVGYPNVSDLYCQDGSENFNSLILDGGKNGNWMIGLEVGAVQPKELAIDGYNVYLNKKNQTETPIKETQYVFKDLQNRPHQVRVNPVYSGFGEVTSKSVTFVINIPSGIESLQNTTLNVTKHASTIEVKGGNVEAIEVVNMGGAVVAKSESNILDIAGLTDGVYVLKIKSEGKTVTTKININK